PYSGSILRLGYMVANNRRACGPCRICFQGGSVPRPILATTSVSALSHNLSAVMARLDQDSPGRRRPDIWAVIKANAYGHGINEVLRGFAEAEGLAMLDLDDAVRCREAGWGGPLLLLEGFFEPADIEVLDHYRISTVLHTPEQLHMLEQTQVVHTIDALLKLSSGMNRLGFQPADYPAAWRRARALQDAGVLGDLGKMTHFARADDD